MNDSAPPPHPGRRITIIFNPVAGNRHRSLLDRCVAAFDRDGWQVTVSGTNGPGNATTLAARAAASFEDVIVAAGGDGTINEVVAGMVGTDIPLGVIPLGTANVLAGEFGLPRQPGPIAAAFAGDRHRRLHVPEADGIPFLLMAGAGFDGAVVQAISPAAKRRLGKLAFVVQGLRAIATGAAYPVIVETGGRTFRAEWAIVTNVACYGGPYRLVPEADPGAPTLTAVLFSRAGGGNIPGYFLRLALGRLDRSRFVTTLKSDAFTLSSTMPGATPVQIDGDAAGTLPRRVAATSRFVDIIVP